MTPFAAIITWSDRPVVAGEADRLLDPISFRCSEGRRSVAVQGASAAVGLRTSVSGERLSDGLAVCQDEQWLAVGDVRLYDKSSLLAALGTQSCDQPDIWLLVRAYRRFGEGILARTVGDFAFVIWDWAARRVHAVRDQFGLRTVFFRRTRDGIAFATDVRQLLALAPQDREIDPEMVLEYLLSRFARVGHSFFSKVTPVLPAHRLVAGPDSNRQSRYWEPSFATFSGSYRDAIEEWRRRFRVSVRDRLRSNHPVAAYLSGGFDSSSIVGAAHEAFESGLPSAGRPVALSALFPGFSCDERPYIEAVLTRCTTFDSFTWDGHESNSGDFQDPQLPMPFLRQGIGRGPRRENQAMSDRDCRVVLKGHGGDALAWGYGALADLAFRGRFFTLLSELAAFKSRAEATRVLRIELARVSPFERAMPIPTWFGPDLRKAFTSGGSAAPSFTGPSHVQRSTWNAVGGPMTSHMVDWAVQAGSDAGVEVRIPYLDVRLVELVLGIPWQHRLPNGDIRRLQREGTVPFLPGAVLGRPRKVVFGVMLGHQIRGNLPRIEALLHDRTWASSRFVDQTSVQKSLEVLQAQDPKVTRPGEWEHIWEISVFEAWLRQVFGYDVTPKEVYMNNSSELVRGSDSPDEARKHYESPVLEPIGNVREILADSGAGSPDGEPPGRTLG